MKFSGRDISDRERQERQKLSSVPVTGAQPCGRVSSIFHGQDGEPGALMLTDITILKRLEMQIRRSDRLASLELFPGRYGA